MKKAYFIDVDNTVYFTKPHTEILMGPLYKLLASEDLGISEADFERAKEEMLRIPFQKVAEKYKIRPIAVNKAIAHLKENEITVPLKVHNEYHFLKALKGLKFIVTAGFEKTQRTKIDRLEIASDFDEIFVIDNTKTSASKKDIFMLIMEKYNLEPKDVLVIGDDAESEIKFGLELGIETFLFDPDHIYPDAKTTYRAVTFKNVARI